VSELAPELQLHLALIFPKQTLVRHVARTVVVAVADSP
jgi:hypothetical protein